MNSRPLRRPPHVALLVETTMSYGRRLLLGVADYVRQHEPWSVYVETRSLYDPVPPWLKTWDGDGIICRLTGRQSANTVRQLGIPYVNLNTSIETSLGAPPIRNDHLAIGQLAAEHLLERGFTQFGYFGFPGHPWSDLRCQGFRQIVESRGHTCRVYTTSKKSSHRYRVRSWEKEVDAVAEWLTQLPKPTGLLASHDYRAMQLLDACRRASVAVPEEIAVLGVDDEDICCELANPPLSSIVPDNWRIGYEAAALLERLMQGKSIPSQTLVVPPLEVITRQSTDITAIDDPVVAKAVRYIREQAFKGINVEDVLQHLEISRSALQVRFRKCMKCSIHDVILGVRIRRARELLAETKLDINAIASLCGFKHVEHFCTTFKQRTGTTPGKHRQRSQRSGTGR